MVRLILITLAIPYLCFAGITTSQNVYAVMGDVNDFSIDGSLVLLVIDSTTGGSVTNSSTTYSVFTNNTTTQKIIASLDAPMPANPPQLEAFLKARLSAPGGSGGISQGTVTLTTALQDLVRDIGITSSSDNQIDLTFEVVTSDGTVPQQSRIITYTLTAQ